MSISLCDLQPDRDGEHAASFHWMGAAAMLREGQAKDMGCGGEGPFAIAVADRVLDQNVVGRPSVGDDGVGPRRLPTVRYHRERPIFDLDTRSRIFGDVAIVGDDHRNGIAYVAHFVPSQDEWRYILTKAFGRQPNKLGNRLSEWRPVGREEGAQIVERVDGTNAGHGQSR